MDKFLRPERFDCDPDDANATPEWKHFKATFDSFIGAITVPAGQTVNRLQLLKNHVSSTVFAKISDMTTFDDAIKTLDSLYIKTKNEVFSRHLLVSRKQQTTESIDSYVQALREHANDCEFKAVSAEEYKSEYIRDAFINGLNSSFIRQRMLESSKLDLESVILQAQTLECAQRSNQMYHNNIIQSAAVPLQGKPHEVVDQTFQDLSTSASISRRHSTGNYNFKKNNNYDKTPKVEGCGNCGSPYIHQNRKSCPAYNKECYSGHKIGHFGKCCRSSNKNNNQQGGTTSAAMFTNSNDEYPFLAAVVASSPKCLEMAVVECKVNNSVAKGLIDSGSSESFMDLNFVRSNKLKYTSISDSKVNMASEAVSVNVVGYIYAEIRIDDRVYKNFKFSILNKLCSDVILGLDFMKLHDEVTFTMGGTQDSLVINNDRIVSAALSKASVEAPQLFSNLSSNCEPIATKSRYFKKEDKAFITEEVSKLLSDGIIEPCISPWRAQVHVTKDTENHKQRLVVDYSETINQFTDLDAYPFPKILELVNSVAQDKIYSTLDLKSAYHQIPIREKERPMTAFEANGQLYQFTRIPFGVTNGVAAFQRVLDNIISENNLEGTHCYVDNITISGMTQQEHDQRLQEFYDVVKKYNLTLNESKSVISTDRLSLLGYTISNGTIQPDSERMEPLRKLPPPTDQRSLKRVVGMFSYYSQWIPNFSEKIYPLMRTETFPLLPDALNSFQRLKVELENVALAAIDESAPFVVETDASDFAIAGSLNQNGRPVAFMSRVLTKSEQRHSSIEKEAQAIIEATRKWSHFLLSQPFTLVTDQRSVRYMFDLKLKHGKIKNDKIRRWRIELMCYNFNIEYRPGKDNHVCDTLSRANCTSIYSSDVPKKLVELHNYLCHPGVTRLLHFVKSKNLPFSVDDVRKTCSTCSICSKLKPKFFRPETTACLIKASQPFERLSVDYKGPLPPSNGNTYLLTIVDEYSRFAFAYPCKNTQSSTVIKCFNNLFSIFGMPNYIHSDRGTSFLSAEIRDYLHSRGIATSKTTPYNPQGNGQCEKYNDIIWRSCKLALATRGLPDTAWEVVLPDVLHSNRSLLSTATNQTPHERMFNHSRRSTSGTTLPSWLSEPGKVLVKRFVRQSKQDPLVDEVELIEANPNYAHIRYPNGRESTVSLRHLAPTPRSTEVHDILPDNVNRVEVNHIDHVEVNPVDRVEVDHDLFKPVINGNVCVESPIPNAAQELHVSVEKLGSDFSSGVRRSLREHTKTDFYGCN